MSGINYLFMGAENPEAFMIGSDEVEVIYFGSEIVYQKGDFSGLKMKDEVTMGKESGSTYDLKIKSSEAWTLSVETAATWLNFSQLYGDSGETIVTIECNEENQTGSARTTTITATTNSFSATCEITQIDVHYVPYIHKSTLSNANYNELIGTGIIASDSTIIRIKGLGKGRDNGDTIVGYDSVGEGYPSYRGFWTSGGRIYFDIQNQRIDHAWNGYANNTPIDVTFSNHSIYDNRTSTMIVTGSPKTITTFKEIKVDVNTWWLQSLQIWDGQTLVFDGQAAVDDANNIIGLYDSVSNTYKYNPNVSMAYEENDVQINWTNTGDVYTAEVSAILVDDFRICQLEDTYVPTPFQPMHAYYEVWLTTANTVVVKALGNGQWNVVATLGSNETFTNNYGLSITNQMFIDEILVEAVDTAYNGVSHEWSWKYRYTSDNGGGDSGGGGDIGGDEEE